ncbi:undecaprenyldiphospho-muramoylpentapeptide beta-N-acetylglucosaminyltransferase [Candidatus Bipolaricaulota bacterium]|nr:undecaprenyldiphospho-muramoylpentapeptide beta-N-acetylglucosaminyltransferase [Candidatus Bipolaricaulota bacterium]
MKILVAGGGTGGHVYPAIAIMEELSRQKDETQIAYIGTKRGIEARILPSYPKIHFYKIHIRGFARRRLFQNLGAILLLTFAVAETLRIILRFRPQLIIGMGGYASFPAVFLGSLLKKPLGISTVIHEQNIEAGLANRFLYPFVDEVLVSYQHSKRYFPRAKRIVITGNPIRKEFLLTKRETSIYHRFGLDPEKKTVLVFGGSHGAAILTQAVMRAREKLSKSEQIQILLITGNKAKERSINKEFSSPGVNNLVVFRYIDRMSDAFAIADLIVSRAGATTLAEITSCGKPALLVPWGKAANEHQWKNARYLESRNACAVVAEKDMTSLAFLTYIKETVMNKEKLIQMAQNSWQLGRRQASTTILGEIRTLLEGAQT